MQKQIGQILLASVLFTAIAQVIHTLGAWLSMPFYLDERFFDVWSKIMMPTAGPPPSSFYYLSLAFGFIASLIFVVAYYYINGCIKVNNTVLKGIYYGLILFALVGLTSALTMILLINLPIALVIYWMFEGLVIYVLGGIVIAGLVK